MKLFALFPLLTSPVYASSNAADLRSTIVSLYNTSHEPYSPTGFVSSEKDPSPFSGCASITSDGTISTDEKLSPLRWAYEVEHDYGPLHPAKRKVLELFSFEFVIKSEVKTKIGKFENGALLMTNDGEPKFIGCSEKGISNRQYFLESSSGINAVGDTYEVVFRCGKREDTRIGYRKSGNYLLVKWVSTEENRASDTSYAYCWK